MLKQIKISGYKSLRSVEVELKPLSVLFGPNGAGKSNFLDALQLLSKLATSRTLKDAFEPPYRGKPLESFSFGTEGMKGLLGTERQSFSIEVDVELSPAVIDAVNRQIREMKRTSPEDEEDASSSKKLARVTEKALRYRIEVEILPKSGLLRVSDEYLTALNRKGEPTGKRKPFLERVGKRLHLRMEGQAHPTYYERHLDHSILSLPNYPPHYPHLVAMRRELESWLFFYFEPRERMRAAGPVKEVRHIGLMGEELAAFLNTLKAVDPPQFKAVEKALRTILPNVEGIDVEVDELGEVELKLRENGVPIPARLLSEGTLRVLGLLALAGAKEQPSLIGFEEPENGIHPRRIQLVAELLKTRASLGETQYIVTTHSPLLPDLMPDDSLFVCQRSSEGETMIEPFSVWGPLGKKAKVDSSLMEEGEEGLTVSERLLRGDFDA
ncbi:AAA family ATPase [Thioalkalivibrio sp.]|uniref:AAA family ATPase n=1 Tax=Thioalkalivibrio sp. TaxID=2093813 RepID=UPI003569B801